MVKCFTEYTIAFYDFEGPCRAERYTTLTVDTLGLVSHHYALFFVKGMNFVCTLPFTYTAGDATVGISDYFKFRIYKFYTHFNMHRPLP